MSNSTCKNELLIIQMNCLKVFHVTLSKTHRKCLKVHPSQVLKEVQILIGLRSEMDSLIKMIQRTLYSKKLQKRNQKWKENMENRLNFKYQDLKRLLLKKLKRYAIKWNTISKKAKTLSSVFDDHSLKCQINHQI